MQSQEKHVETLISIASRQIWPQVLAVMHLKPKNLFLLHSDDSDESKGPARRLNRNLSGKLTGWPNNTRLVTISHKDFNEIKKGIADLAAEEFNDQDQCAVNFTGGNKLMATAAFHWAAENGVRSFYLERGNQLTWFEPNGTGLYTSVESLRGCTTNHLEPLPLLRCQLTSSEVECEGQELRLNEAGIKIDECQFKKLFAKENSVKKFLEIISKYLEIKGTAGGIKKGDALEFYTAAVLLKAGVSEVRRSVRLKVKPEPGQSSKSPHAEIDLLFNWNGRLWLVDCKDRVSVNDLIDGLRRVTRYKMPSVSAQAKKLVDRIGDELHISPTKVLKENQVVIDEIGGLQGQVVCVRTSHLSQRAEAYAKRNGMQVVLKKNLFEGIKELLHP